jgi:hypothetical protein
MTKQSTSRSNQITPRGAVVFGLLFIVCGMLPVLGGLGVINVRPAPGVTQWVVVAAGALFILGGLAIINGYALWGAPSADGDLPAGAPFAAKVVQFLLGMSMVGVIFAVFAWIAFGPGERHFSISLGIPGLWTDGQGSERTGRVVFGAVTVLIGLFFVAATMKGARRLLALSHVRGSLK